MKKTAVAVCALIAFITLGEGAEPQPRCESLALEIVKSGFEDRPVVEKQMRLGFDRLRCPEFLLELQRQRIINAEVKPWFEVHG